MNRVKKYWLIAVLLSSVLVLGACSEVDDSYPLMVGGTVNFEQLQGKFVMLVYWADWSSTSKQAMAPKSEMV